MPQKEHRKYDRYDTEVKIYFHVAYDIKTKVRFQVMDKAHKPASPQYIALSKNVSAEGICFSSEKNLHKGDFLSLEVYVPGGREPIPMQGEVRWCEPSPKKHKGEKRFDTGVQLHTVNSESVEKSIYHDKVYQVVWSTVLESVLGNFRILEQKRHKNFTKK
ncbi:MAG: hypothetical protein A2787_00610 [Omnitrophica WOR_2 bacterium RIFCSPHIGHO2_01_FULL_48_9]|nr:MAG: hypothetical protein A3D10_02695 [Omnitrophica WOR_2 bacterium RIFCSPHIGHO2_02_FULL_48_11]OGX33633.1 MAG: hypothetical protein A2787_00610 [Omnitrophica WOR_2 bacterium RIFCSPHIGHO2_01_FULL_48_9]